MIVHTAMRYMFNNAIHTIFDPKMEELVNETDN